jgi:hypothetical protein
VFALAVEQVGMAYSIGRRCRSEDDVRSDREKQAIGLVRFAFAFAVGGFKEARME